MSDGSIVFDTKMDASGVKKGISESKAAVNALLKEIDAATKARDKLEAQYNKAPSADTLTQPIKQAEEEAENLKAKIAELQEQMSAVNKLSSLQDEFNRQQAINEQSRLTGQFPAPEEDGSPEKLEALGSQINELKAQLGSVNTDQLQKDLDTNNAQLEKAEATADKLKEKLATTTTKESLKPSLDAANQNIENLHSLAETTTRRSKIGQVFSSISNSVRSGLGKITGLFRSNNDGLDRFNQRLNVGIKSILKYAIGIRSLFVLFNRLRNAIRTGITNMMEVNNGNNAVANSVRSLQTSLTYLQNAWAAAFAPILNAVAPILTTLIDMLAAAGNAIARFMAMITGKGTYQKAVKGANQYAKATSGVGSAAKQAADDVKGQLAAIDEVNDISTQSNSGSSGGGGGGGGGLDYDSMFETAQVAGDSVIDAMKKAIENGDWEGAGKILSDKVNSMFANIDWESAGKSFGTGLAHVIQLAYGFLENLDTHAIGADLAAWVNGAIESMDWSTAGALLVRGFTAAIDFVMGFLLNLDYGQIAIALSHGIEGAMDELTAWLNGIDWAQVGAQSWQNLKDFFGNLDYSGLATSFFTLLGTAFRSCVLLLGGFFGNIGADIKTWWDTSIQGENWIETASNLLKAIGKGFADIGQWAYKNIIDPFMSALLGEDKWADIKQVASDIWNGFTKGLKEFFDNPGKWIKKHMIDPFVNWVKDLLGIHSPSTVFIEIGRDVILGLHEGLTQKWDKIKDFFDKGFENIKNTISDKWEEVKENTKSAWDKITDVLGDAKKGIKDKWHDVKDWFGQHVTDPVKEKFRGLGQNISSKMDSAKQGVQTSWNTVGGYFGNVRSGINQKFQDVNGWFREKFNSAKDGLKSGFSQSSIYSHMHSVKNSIGSVFSDVNGWFREKFNSAKDGLKSGFSQSSIYSHMYSVRNSISSVFSGIWSTAHSWGRDMMDGLKAGINSAKGYVTSAARSVASGIKSLLHFSRPDEGPLRDYEQWMPDMMEGLASGIESSMPVVDRAMAKLANHMGGSLQVEPNIPDLALGKVIPAAMSLSGSAASNQQETMQQLVDAVNELREQQNDNSDVIRALETLISVVRSKKLLTSDVGKAAADYANSEYERTGETIFEGV